MVTTYRPSYGRPGLDKSYATQLALPRRLPQDSRAVGSRRWLIQAPADMGAFAEGIIVAEDALRLAEADGHPFTLYLGQTVGTISKKHGKQVLNDEYFAAKS